jgi:hypothetical protein
MPLTPLQKDAALLCFDALCLKKPDVLDYFHRLSWSFVVVQPDTADVTDWSCPFRCFFAVLALQEDGGLMSPDTFSGYGAKFKYFCNTAAIYEADTKSSSHHRGMIGYALDPI